VFNGKFKDNANFQPRDGYGIAIDIGTTTVVLALLDLSCGKIITRHSFFNPQRRFGPDVISRIKAANEGYLDELRCLIIESLLKGFNELLEFQKIQPNQIIDISIAANTTMIYLLLGFPCVSLGCAPFKPSYSLAQHYTFNDIFSSQEFSCQVQIIPWFAAFAGGDIMAGLIHLLSFNKKRFFLIDLGTNGELALYSDGKLTITSAAAGPVLENGKNTASGIIHDLAVLLQDCLIDKTGKLLNDVLGSITQKDIRELQLAKSAVRSGLEIILETSGFTYNEIDAVYLAGGIGQAMNINDAVKIGLIPFELKDKCSAVGNSALGGAVCKLFFPKTINYEIENLLSDFTEINLASHSCFNEYFMEYMEF